MNRKLVFAIAVAGAALLGAAQAADLKVVSSVGMQAVLQELAPQFERASSHKVTLVLGTAAVLKRQVEAGEAFDVVILTPPMIDDLVKQGKVAAGTKLDVAKVGLGAAIRAGAPKPDISTPEAFKKALLESKGIVHSKEGQSGAHMVKVIDRLGIAEQMKAKTLLETRSGHSAIAVVEGKADLGFALISEILPVKGAELLGPLPADLQGYVPFAAGLAPAAKDADAAKAFLRFLTAPAALPVLKAKGMEPG